MPLRSYYRSDLALAQLETALRLYFEAADYAAVVTLAGAAEEIFGKLLTAAGKDNSLEALKRAVGEMHLKLYGEQTPPKQIANRANHARNGLKHWDQGDSELINIDLREEAQDMLFRAIENYWLLDGRMSEAMERFQREITAAYPFAQARTVRGGLAWPRGASVLCCAARPSQPTAASRLAQTLGITHRAAAYLHVEFAHEH